MKNTTLFAFMFIFVFGSVWGLFRLGFHRADAESIQSSVRQLRLLAEETYDNSGGTYRRWSTNPLVEDDVQQLRRSVHDSLGSPENRAVGVVIIDSYEKEYCISAPLDVEKDEHYCVDATGVFTTTNQPCSAPKFLDEPLVCPEA